MGMSFSGNVIKKIIRGTVGATSGVQSGNIISAVVPSKCVLTVLGGTPGMTLALQDETTLYAGGVANGSINYQLVEYA